MFRKLIKIFLGLVLLVGIIIGLLLLPPVQRTLFLWVANTDERQVSVETFRIGWGSVSIESLELSQENMALRLPKLDLQFSARALFNRTLRVDKLTAENFYFQSREVEEVEEDKDLIPILLPADFDGLLAFDWGIDLSNLFISGNVVLGDASPIHISATSLALRPGTTGNLLIELKPDSANKSPIPASQMRIPIRLDENGRIEKVEILATIEPLVSDETLPLKLDVILEKDSDGKELYSLNFSGAESATGEDTVLAKLKGEWNPERSQLALDLKIKITQLSFLEAFTDTVLPELSLDLSAKTSLVPGTRKWQAEMDVTAIWMPNGIAELNAPVDVQTALSISSSSDGDITLRRMTASVLPHDSSHPWLQLKLLQAQTLSVDRLQELPQDTFASLELDLPSGLLESFAPGWSISDLKGGWLFSGKEDSLQIAPKGLWKITVGRKESNVPPASISFEPAIQMSSEEITFDLSFLRISDSRRGSLSTDAKGRFQLKSKFLEDLEVRSEGSIAVLEAFLSPEIATPTGNIEMILTGSMRDLLQGNIHLTASNFSMGGSAQGNSEITIDPFSWNPENGQVEASLRAHLQNRDGSSSIDPLHFTIELAKNEDERLRLSIPESKMDLHIPSLLAWLPSEEPQADAFEKTSDPVQWADFLKTPILLPIDLGMINGEWKIQDPSLPHAIQIKLSGYGPTHGENQTMMLSLFAFKESTQKWADIEMQSRLSGEGQLDRLSLKLKTTENAYLNNLPPFFIHAIYQTARPEEWITLRMASSESSATLISTTIAPLDDDIKISTSMDLSAWSQSPLRSWFPNLQTGQLRTEWTLGQHSAVGNLAIGSLSAREHWDVFNLRGRMDVQWDPTLVLESNFTLTSSKSKEETKFELTAHEQAMDPHWVIQFKSSPLNLNSLQNLGATLETGTFPTVPATKSSESAPTAPAEAWPLHDFGDTVAFDGEIEALILPDLNTKLENIQLSSRISSDVAHIKTSLQFLNNANLDAEATLQPGGRGVAATITTRADQVSLVRLFQLMNPGETPPVTGLMSLKIDLKGNASSMETLPDFLVGEISLDARDGVIRSLQPEDRVGRMAQVGSLAGAILGEVIDRPGIGALSQMIDLFSSIPYQQMGLQLRREADQSTQIQVLRLRGPYLSLDGKGGIESSTLQDIPVTPMNLTLSLGSRPPLTRPLEILGLSGTERTSDDYQQWRKSYRITGTLTEPDVDGLWDDIADAAERAATLRSRDLKPKDDQEKKTEKEKEKPRQRPEDELIEQGVNELFRIFGR